MSAPSIYGHQEIGPNSNVTVDQSSNERESDDLDVKSVKAIRTQEDFMEFGVIPVDEFRSLKQVSENDGDDDGTFDLASVLMALNYTSKELKVYFWQVAQVDPSNLSLVQPKNMSFSEPRWIATLPPSKTTVATIDWISIPLAVDIRITSFKKSCDYGGRTSKAVSGGISVLQTAPNGKGRFNLQCQGDNGLVLTPSNEKNLQDGEFVIKLLDSYPDNTNFQVSLMQNGKQITNEYVMSCNKKIFRIVLQKKFECALASIQGKNVYLGNEKHDIYLGECAVATYTTEKRSRKIELGVYVTSEYISEAGN